MPHVDDGISTFSRDVSWILRLGSGGAAAKFERHIVDGVGPGVSEDGAQPVAEPFIDGQLECVILAQPIGGEVIGVTELRIERVERPSGIERC